MQGHDLHSVVAARALEVEHQGDVLQVGLQVLELAHGLDQLLQVLQPPLALRPAVGAQHVGVAALVEHRLQQLALAHVVA